MALLLAACGAASPPASGSPFAARPTPNTERPLIMSSAALSGETPLAATPAPTDTSTPQPTATPSPTRTPQVTSSPYAAPPSPQAESSAQAQQRAAVIQTQIVATEVALKATVGPS